MLEITVKILQKYVSYIDLGDLISDLKKLPSTFDHLLPRLTKDFFSVLKRVKTYLQNTCDQINFSNLLLIDDESEHAKQKNFD